MGTSGNPAKRAEELKISQIGDFKNRLGGIQELPSGLIVKVRNPGGLQVFLDSGIIPNSLMNIIQDAIKKGQQPKPEDILGKEGDLDMAMMGEMMTMMDGIAMRCIVEPIFHPVPTEADVQAYNDALDPDEEPITSPEQLRSDEKLYIDELPMDDKSFIFQWISGGTRDLEKFREGLDRNVGAVAKVSVTRAAAVRPPRAKRG